MDEDVKGKFPAGRLGPLQRCPSTVVCIGASVLNMKARPWTRAWHLVSKNVLVLFSFQTLERNTANVPPVGWSNPQGWDLKPQSVVGPSGPSVSSGGLRSSCLRTGAGAGDVAVSVRVAFHNVTPRHRNRALALSRISQYLGRDFNVTQVQILYVNFLVGSFSYE